MLAVYTEKYRKVAYSVHISQDKQTFKCLTKSILDMLFCFNLPQK